MGGDEVVTKSGLMVGLGEEFDEMVEAFGILREHGVQVLTVGQYLRPTEKHLPVDRYWHPGRVRGAGEGRLRARASSRSPRGRWSAARTTRTSSSRPPPALNPAQLSLRGVFGGS